MSSRLVRDAAAADCCGNFGTPVSLMLSRNCRLDQTALPMLLGPLAGLAMMTLVQVTIDRMSRATSGWFEARML